jgi:cytochrome bd ubiquinol oxidase subunit I
MDPLILSRIQFAANISFHILFPVITIALGWFLLFFKIRYSMTKNFKWMDIYFFWTKVFALCFALGVVSGITMSFQFGTNWPGFMNTVGNVAGPLLGYEVLTAFFLEATFLGIMLFGFRKVKPWLHTTATVLVALGTTLSAFWILALNSWMHTPAGFVMVNGEAIVTDWFEVIFNPSFPYRFTHKLLASGLTASFLIAGISAYRYLKGQTNASVTTALKTAIIAAAFIIPIQIFAGDLHGINTYKYQPQKVAAMEGNWETQKGIPLILFALPDETTRTNKFSIEIPKLSSLIITHDLDGEVKGLNDFIGDHPPVAPVFWSFRIMVATGMTMLAVSWFGAFFYIRKKSLPKFYYKILCYMTFSGWIATLAGWYVTEIGRQPYLVQGVLKTVDAVTKVPGSYVALSLTIYLIVYALLLVAFVSTVFYMARKYQDKIIDESEFDPTTGQRRTLLGVASFNI